MSYNQSLQVAGVDSQGNPIYVQAAQQKLEQTPVITYHSSPHDSIPSEPNLYSSTQVAYVPDQPMRPNDHHDITMGLDQHGLGRFVLRHQGTSKTADGHVKQHQAKSWLGGYGKLAEYAETSFFLLIEVFKITMACLLAVFVPQACLPLSGDPTLAFTFTGSVLIPDGTPGGKVYNNVIMNAPDYYDYNNIPHYHECSIYENFIQLTNLNIAALVFNFLSWALCVFHFWLLWKRERFFIDHFDFDPKKNRIHLRFQVASYPHIESKMYRYNLFMFWTSILCITILTVNMILSGILVFQYYYLGTRTATVFITNCLLLGSTMTRTAESAFLGAHNNIALSSIDYEPVSYNVVDEVYVKMRYGDDAGVLKPGVELVQPTGP